MSKEKADALKQQILSLVEEYHKEVSGDAAPFEAGTSRIPYAGRVYDSSEMMNLVDSALEFWLTHGRWAEEFEQGLSRYLGVRHAYFVNSGSSANLLAFMALTSPRLGERRIERGDEVITVAAGFPTTVAPIVQYGAVPVFVDVLLETANVDPSLLEPALSGRTKAVMLAHTLGNTFDVDAVRAFCQRHGLWLIEDNCDALGSRYRGELTGTFGDLATSSFYPPHHMTTGEGGAVCTSDHELARIVLSMRDWGRDCVCMSGEDNRCGKRFDHEFEELPEGYDHKYVYAEWGYNLKATDLQAAIGCAQLEKLQSFVEARRCNFARLHEALTPIADDVTLPEPTPDSEPSWFGFLMMLPERGPSRERVIRQLEADGIQTRMLFAGNIVRQPCFDAMRETLHTYRVVGELAKTDAIMRRSFWVGVYPGMTDEMLDHMAGQIITAVRAR